MSGVLLNILTVAVGTIIGVVFGRLIPERFRQIAFYAIGSCTIAFGVVMVVNGHGDLSETQMGSMAAVVLVVSLIVGALTGELLRIDQRLEILGFLMQKFLPARKKHGATATSVADEAIRTAASDAGEAMKSATSLADGAIRTTASVADEAMKSATPVADEAMKSAALSSSFGGTTLASDTSEVDQGDAPDEASNNEISDKTSPGSTFAEGFMTASVLFCVGAMTIMGSIQAGLGDPSTLYLKATLDGVAAIALSTALGIGVGFSVVTIAAVQGGLVLAAGALAGYVSSATMASIELVGGAMLIALGIDILGIKKLKAGNMLPALVYAIVLAAVFG